MAKKKHEEEHESAERYILTYADLITLLLGLFILLYSMSQQDIQKFRSYSAAFNLVFGSGGGKGVPIGLDPVLVGEFPKPGFRSGRSGGASGSGSGAQQQMNRELQSLSQGEKGEEKFQVKQTSEGTVISLPEKLTFSSGQADLKPAARAVLDSLSEVFKKYNSAIRIEGHTDNMPISGTYPNNMALSVARAINAYTYLVERHGFDPNRAAGIMGYGELRPVAENDTPEGRAKNRRIDIVVVGSEAPAPSGKAGGTGGAAGETRIPVAESPPSAPPSAESPPAGGGH
jgi:chemotaxis protein MotB